MIATDNLTKQFGTVKAVEDLSLEIPEGEVFGFLGPNGAGKTTTVRLLTCLIAPTSGTARVNGLSVGKDDTNIRRSVGVLTETPGMYDNLSAERNLSIYASLYEVKDVKGQVEKYLRLLGLWERRSEPAGAFSKGMKQKLAIARALLHEPRTVFLDEPTSALDPISTAKIEELIHHLKQDYTIIIVTHNMQQAARISDYTAFFYMGELIEFDKTKKIFTNPEKKRTENYITGRFG